MPDNRDLEEKPGERTKMGVKRWRAKSGDRCEWKEICEAAKVLQEL